MRCAFPAGLCLALVGLAGCGVDSASTAATAARLQAQQAEQGRQAVDAVNARLDAAARDAEERLRRAEGAANGNDKAP